MTSWKERIDKISFLSLCLLACFPVLNMKITVYAIILFTFMSILSGVFFNTDGYASRHRKELLILLLPFLLIFGRTFILDRTEESLFYLEVSLSLVAFPIAFFLSSVHYANKQRQIVSAIFICSSVAVVAYGEISVFIRLQEMLARGELWNSTSQMLSDPSLSYYIRTFFEEAVTLHPTHASLFLGISALLTTDFMLKNFTSLRVSSWIWIAISILIILTLQVILASRTPFAATMIGMLVLFFLYLQSKRQRIYAVLILGTLSVLMVVLVPTFSARFSEVSIHNTSVPTEDHEDSFNLRSGIYKCSFEVIGKNWLWGIGPGNVQHHLNICYDKISKEVYNDKNYNTHNQFLDYWAGMGIPGLLSLLIIFGYSAYMNFKRNEKSAFVLTLFFFMACFTENILTRQNGVVTFAFFIGMFFYSTPTKIE